MFSLFIQEVDERSHAAKSDSEPMIFVQNSSSKANKPTPSKKRRHEDSDDNDVKSGCEYKPIEDIKSKRVKGKARKTRRSKRLRTEPPSRERRSQSVSIITHRVAC